MLLVYILAVQLSSPFGPLTLVQPLSSFYTSVPLLTDQLQHLLFCSAPPSATLFSSTPCCAVQFNPTLFCSDPPPAILFKFHSGSYIELHLCCSVHLHSHVSLFGSTPLLLFCSAKATLFCSAATLLLCLAPPPAFGFSSTPAFSFSSRFCPVQPFSLLQERCSEISMFRLSSAVLASLRLFTGS